MIYYPIRSPHHVPPKPIVQIGNDDCNYINMNTVNDGRKKEIMYYLQQHQPGRFKTITEDPFVKLLQEKFGAAVTLKRREHTQT